MTQTNLRIKILHDCQLGAVRYDLTKALLYFDLGNEECSAISLPCLSGTRETNFILESYGKVKSWSEAGPNWYGKTMDFVVVDDIILALVNPATKEVCITETPIVCKRSGFLGQFYMESSEDYIKEKYDFSIDEFITLINEDYSTRTKKESTKVKKIGELQ